MSSKVLIPFLCLGAVAFACGPRARNEASTPRRDSVALASSKAVTAPVAMQQGSARPTRKSGKVDAELFVRTNGGEISLALHVVNNTKKNVELTFATGQTHDFVVVDSLGREVWRWAQGQIGRASCRERGEMW